MLSILNAYYRLTKPTIMLLVVFTGATALLVEGSLIHHPGKFLLVLVGLYLTGGCANALNQYLERDIDAQMARTRNRRPLPMSTISPTHALVFSVAIGVVGVWLFAHVFNLLTAALAMGTILFYSLFYTIVLKPWTPQNIVIGGVAGAMAPVGAWTAATGTMAVAPWIMFLIVFFWTPPHFWALALFCKDDYVRSGLPMMPVVKGDSRTLREMFVYSIILVATSLALLAFGAGWLYGCVAAALGLVFLQRAYRALRLRGDGAVRSLFGFSIVYLFALFFAMIADRYLI